MKKFYLLAIVQIAIAFGAYFNDFTKKEAILLVIATTFLQWAVLQFTEKRA